MINLALFSIALSAASAGNFEATDVQRQYERWERRLRARVAQLHIQPAGADKSQLGDVTVGFSIGRDGRPVDAVILKSSGIPDYDRAARRVVRLLGPVGTVPSLSGAPHKVQLKLSYGQASMAAADRSIAATLETECRAYTGRNLEIVTKAPVRTAFGDGE